MTDEVATCLAKLESVQQNADESFSTDRLPIESLRLHIEEVAASKGFVQLTKAKAAASQNSDKSTLRRTRNSTILDMSEKKGEGAMAHLPNFGYAEPIRVPYECKQEFHGSFHDYPARRGWDEQRLLHRDLQGKTGDEARSFLQEWLYFGLLHSFLDIPGLDFRHNDFVVESEDRRWVSTVELPRYLRKYRSMLDAARTSLSFEQQQQKRRDIAACLQTHHKFTIEYCLRKSDAAKFGPVPDVWPMTPELSLSIGVLAGAFFLTNTGWNLASLSWKTCAWGLKDMMVSSGWCPSQVSELAAVDDLYTAYTLGRPVVRADHMGKQCGSRICNVNQLDLSTYETMHVVDGCKCEFKGPPVDELVERLRNGITPSIRVYESDNGVNVRLANGSEQESANVSYVAISHVWSDGLGNPKNNTLPICQLRRLQGLVNATSTSSAPIAWWCDTLCVPVSSDLKKYRNLAIQKIEEVFRKAERALALDASLLQTPVDSGPLEVFMRLRLSNWMRRVWTLSEGIMANIESTMKVSIFVQLQGGFKEIRSIQTDVIPQEKSSERALYSTYSLLPINVLSPLLQRHESLQKPRHFQVFETWRAIRRRATSWRRDETLCMANILRLENVDKLLQLSTEDFQGQMIWFLQAVGTLIVDILFQPCERLSVVGFRWAPVSFLSCFANTDWENGAFFQPGSIGPNDCGFLFQRQGLRLERGEDSFPLIGEDCLISHDQGAENLYLGYIGSGPDLAAARNNTNVDGSQNLMKPAVILGYNIRDRPRTLGILVDIFEESKDGCISCFFISRVGILPSSQRPPTTKLKQLGATMLHESQEWLIM